MSDLSIRTIVLRPFATARKWSKSVPADLALVIGFVALAVALLAVWNVSSRPVRGAVGIPLLLFAPGYAVVSLFLPRSTSLARTVDGSSLVRQEREFSDVERVALSFGLSFALLPPLGLAVAVSSWEFTQSVVVGVVSGFVLVCALLAAVRRARVPPTERYRVEVTGTFYALGAAIFGANSRARTAVNVALVISVLLAMTTVGYALVAPQQGERYTSLQLLTEDESGDLVASGYPPAVEPDEPIPLVVEIENHEGQHAEYAVVVQQQRVEDDEVVDRTRLDGFTASVVAGGTETAERSVAPTGESGTVRVAVLLYVDGVPEEPTTENAYRHVYFWTDVTEDAGAAADDGEED